jgi:hypothetical protein
MNKLGAAVAAALVVAAALGACGGGGGGTTPDVNVEEQAGLTGDAVIERQAHAENLVRDCMKGQGFDYVPVDPAAQRTALVGTGGLTNAEFEKQYGYGLTTLYEQRQNQLGAGPNVAVRNALSAPERTTYDRALYGDDPTQTFEVALDTGDFTKLGGCVKQAAEKVFGGAEMVRNLTAKLDELDQRIVADPRMVDAIRKWSACMRIAGYDLADPDAVDTTLQQKLDDIVGPSGNRVPDYDKAALSALQREEVAMVAADTACESKHISDVEDKVRVEYEREFRQQNADLLKQVPKP